MAASWTVDATADKRRGNTEIAPNLYMVTGTVTPGGDATVTMDFTASKTNLEVLASKIVHFQMHNTEAVSEGAQYVKNKTGAGAAAEGKVGILASADATNNTFEYMCIYQA